MYDGRDVGELYDIGSDPDEMNNLYESPDHQDIVHECRRRLLEWLTDTTRITTMWPYLEEDEPAFALREPFKMSPDGREPNTKGPRGRLARGKIGSFEVRDYL